MARSEPSLRHRERSDLGWSSWRSRCSTSKTAPAGRPRMVTYAPSPMNSATPSNGSKSPRPNKPNNSGSGAPPGQQGRPPSTNSGPLSPRC